MVDISRFSSLVSFLFIACFTWSSHAVDDAVLQGFEDLSVAESSHGITRLGAAADVVDPSEDIPMEAVEAVIPGFFGGQDACAAASLEPKDALSHLIHSFASNSDKLGPNVKDVVASLQAEARELGDVSRYALYAAAIRITEAAKEDIIGDGTSREAYSRAEELVRDFRGMTSYLEQFKGKSLRDLCDPSLIGDPVFTSPLVSMEYTLSIVLDGFENRYRHLETLSEDDLVGLKVGEKILAPKFRLLHVPFPGETGILGMGTLVHNLYKGIFPLPVATKHAFAHRDLMSPLEFLVHDLSHALSSYEEAEAFLTDIALRMADAYAAEEDAACKLAVEDVKSFVDACIPYVSQKYDVLNTMLHHIFVKVLEQATSKDEEKAIQAKKALVGMFIDVHEMDNRFPLTAFDAPLADVLDYKNDQLGYTYRYIRDYISEYNNQKPLPADEPNHDLTGHGGLGNMVALLLNEPLDTRLLGTFNEGIDELSFMGAAGLLFPPEPSFEEGMDLGDARTAALNHIREFCAELSGIFEAYRDLGKEIIETDNLDKLYQDKIEAIQQEFEEQYPGFARKSTCWEPGYNRIISAGSVMVV